MVIALAPEYWGRAIGRRLIEKILREVATAGRPVRFQAAWYNRPARSLYEGLGFRVTEDNGVYCEMQWLPGTGPIDKG